MSMRVGGGVRLINPAKNIHAEPDTHRGSVPVIVSYLEKSLRLVLKYTVPALLENYLPGPRTTIPP